MIANNSLAYSFKLVLDVFKMIVFFPVWWYSFGFFNLLVDLGQWLMNKEKSLALFIWIKNIAKPMYAQHDLSGMLISFFMRLFQIFFRSLALLLYAVAAVFILIIWLSLPLVVLDQIFFQIS